MNPHHAEVGPHGPWTNLGLPGGTPNIRCTQKHPKQTASPDKLAQPILSG